jgi:hypothetical protein
MDTKNFSYLACPEIGISLFYRVFSQNMGGGCSIGSNLIPLPTNTINIEREVFQHLLEIQKGITPTPGIEPFSTKAMHFPFRP